MKNYAHLTIDNVIFLTFVKIILLILIIKNVYLNHSHFFISTNHFQTLNLFGNSNDNSKWKYNRNKKRRVSSSWCGYGELHSLSGNMNKNKLLSNMQRKIFQINIFFIYFLTHICRFDFVCWWDSKPLLYQRNAVVFVVCSIEFFCLYGFCDAIMSLQSVQIN